MTAPVVLHLNNAPALNLSSRVGFAPAFARLADEGHLVSVTAEPQALLAEAGAERALRTVRQIALEGRPNLVFVQSPHGFPWTAETVGTLLGDLGRPPVIYWEGDAWGGRKSLGASSAAWLAHADAVFSAAMGEQALLLGRHSRVPVRYIPNVLPCQLIEDETAVPPIGQTAFDVAHVGNRYVRFGFLERVEGARDRLRLVRGLTSLPDCRVALYGSGWHGRVARGPIPFDRQTAALRDALITVGWSHFPHYPGSFSNRLPISMYAGRVHVSSRPPGIGWLPGPDSGLHLVDTPAEAVARIRTLLRESPDELHTAGLRAHRWTRDRFTELHALLYMLGGELALPDPPDDPWSSVADLDPCTRPTAAPSA